MMSLRRSLMMSLLLAAVTLAPSRGAAEDDDATREKKAAQLIFNALQMSNEKGAPIAPLVAKFKQLGTSSGGVGYRGEQVGHENGSTFVCAPGITFLNQTGLALSLDQAAGQLGAVRIGSDRRTGAAVYVQKDSRGDADRILFLMRRGNVQIYMLIDRTETDAEEMTRRSIHRWRFMVDEAKRLGLFEDTTPPQLVIKVWDARKGEWQTIGDREAFARRLARLHKEETLLVEVEVDSELLSGSEAYEFDIRVQKGEKLLQLREADGQTQLADPDRDGWNEVRVEPVDGRHPPRRLTAVFAAEPAKSRAYSQKAAVDVRYADDSGKTQQRLGLVRAIPTIVVTQFELRSTQQSALIDLFTRSLDPQAAEAFRASRLEPGTWFNGVWDSNQDLQVSWCGYFSGLDDGSDIEGLWWRVAVTGAPPNSQYATGRGINRPYLGWTRDLREGSAGTGFLVMEDPPNAPLQVGPFAGRDPVNVYVEISIQEDLASGGEMSGGGSVRELIEREIQVREKLEIGSGREATVPLEVSLWHVDDLEDLKDESGRVTGFSAAKLPRIKAGLRKPTGRQVTDASGKPRTFYTWRTADSRVIDEYFPLKVETLGRPLPFGTTDDGQFQQRLDLEPGIYELQFRLILQDREVEEGEDYPETWDQHVALRFWVMDLPDISEGRVLQGLDTERGGAHRRLRHRATGTGLLEAAKSGDPEALAAALRAGAEVDAPDEQGVTPLGWATSLGHHDTVRLLLKAGADVHRQTARGQSPLNVAAARDDAPMVRLLLQAGADVNERIQGKDAPDFLKGATPLFLAARQAGGAALEELVRAGANVNAANAQGATILHLQAEAGDAQGVRRLLALGAEPGRADRRGVTPLMAAAHGGSAECVWLLVDGGAKPNTATSSMNPGPYAGFTALMAAAEAGSETATVALLLSGARPEARTFDGKTALDLARAGGHKSLAELLAHPESVKSSAARVFMKQIGHAVENGRWEYVKLLVRHGVDVNAPDEDGIPPLLKAASENRLEAVRGLLAVGANVDARDREMGATALMDAAFNGRLEMVSLLLEAGARVNLAARGDEDGEAAGWTALMGAALSGNAEIVQALLAAGADRSIVNAKGQTALDMAREARGGNKARVIQLLSDPNGGGR